MDERLNVLLDIYVRPRKQVFDYRTRYSGIRKCHMMNAVPMEEARRRVMELIKVMYGEWWPVVRLPHRVRLPHSVC